MAQSNPPQSLALTPEEIEHIQARRAAAEAEAEAQRKAEVERAAREKADAEARVKAETAARGAAKARVRGDTDDVQKLLDGVQQCTAAIRSIRARIPSPDTGDATPSAGRLLQALLRRGGTLREYQPGHVWALKHALGGEGHELAPLDRAAIIIVTTLIEGLAEPRSAGEAERRENVREELEAIAKILIASETRSEAVKEIDRVDRANAEARARAHQIAHDQRRAQAAKGHPAFAPVVRAVPVATTVEGEYIPADSADAPGATLPVG
jgi:colicin import membrane protein